MSGLYQPGRYPWLTAVCPGSAIRTATAGTYSGTSCNCSGQSVVSPQPKLGRQKTRNLQLEYPLGTQHGYHRVSDSNFVETCCLYGGRTMSDVYRLRKNLFPPSTDSLIAGHEGLPERLTPVRTFVKYKLQLIFQRSYGSKNRTVTRYTMEDPYQVDSQR